MIWRPPALSELALDFMPRATVAAFRAPHPHHRINQERLWVNPARKRQRIQDPLVIATQTNDQEPIVEHATVEVRDGLLPGIQIG